MMFKRTLQTGSNMQNGVSNMVFNIQFMSEFSKTNFSKLQINLSLITEYAPYRAVSRENLSSGFSTRSLTNMAVQPLKIARGLKFRI